MKMKHTTCKQLNPQQIFTVALAFKHHRMPIIYHHSRNKSPMRSQRSKEKISLNVDVILRKPPTSFYITCDASYRFRHLAAVSVSIPLQQNKTKKLATTSRRRIKTVVDLNYPDSFFLWGNPSKAIVYRS